MAAFGFLSAYFLITIAAPFYLRKLGELKHRNVAVAIAAFLCLLVPTVGSFYPAPPYPVNLFPYLFLAFMLLGGARLYQMHRAEPQALPAIQRDSNGRWPPRRTRSPSRRSCTRRSRTAPASPVPRLAPPPASRHPPRHQRASGWSRRAPRKSDLTRGVAGSGGPPQRFPGSIISGSLDAGGAMKRLGGPPSV